MMPAIETLEGFRAELGKLLRGSAMIAVPDIGDKKDKQFEYDRLELSIASLALDYVEGFSRRIIHDVMSGKG